MNMWFERSENARQKICEHLGPRVESFAVVCYLSVISAPRCTESQVRSLKPPVDTYTEL